LRIAFVMPGAPGRHPLWSLVADRLTGQGAQVAFLWPDEGVTDLSQLRVEHDLYVVKYRSGLGLSLAGALHALGAATFNPYPVMAICRDKIMTSSVLASAGVPVPHTWVMDDVGAVRSLLDGGPIVVKPHLGSDGIGVQVLFTPAEVDNLELQAGPVFAQRYHAPDGPDHKLYLIGGNIFGVRRVWPPRTIEDKLGEVSEPSDDLRAIAHKCSTALGIDTFGLDVVYSGGEPVCVDLSAFPGFKGVPAAETPLADAILAAAERGVPAPRVGLPRA
jgi:ribosomal protein S6--L-glutamate ligase